MFVLVVQVKSVLNGLVIVLRRNNLNETVKIVVTMMIKKKKNHRVRLVVQKAMEHGKWLLIQRYQMDDLKPKICLIGPKVISQHVHQPMVLGK